MTEFKVKINGVVHAIETDQEMPVLWVLRDLVGLTGTKFGFGIGMCGACTVHLDGKAVRSCLTPIKSVGAKNITTIEGLSATRFHAVQEAWMQLQVPQCGYCQSGQIMAATALLNKNPHPDLNEINSAMSGNLCRCGTYDRIKKAIELASEKLNQPRNDTKN